MRALPARFQAVSGKKFHLRNRKHRTMSEKKIEVTAYSGYRGEETPREFISHGKKVRIVEILNAWIEEKSKCKSMKRVFKVKGSDGSIHQIHYDEDKKEWFCELEIGK